MIPDHAQTMTETQQTQQIEKACAEATAMANLIAITQDRQATARLVRAADDLAALVDLRYSVVIVPIWRTEDERSVVMSSASWILAQLEDEQIWTKIDTRDRPGMRFNRADHDLDVKVIIQVGPQDVRDGVTYLRRATPQLDVRFERVKDAELFATVERMIGAGEKG